MEVRYVNWLHFVSAVGRAKSIAFWVLWLLWPSRLECVCPVGLVWRVTKWRSRSMKQSPSIHPLEANIPMHPGVLHSKASENLLEKENTGGVNVPRPFPAHKTVVLPRSPLVIFPTDLDSFVATTLRGFWTFDIPVSSMFHSCRGLIPTAKTWRKAWRNAARTNATALAICVASGFRTDNYGCRFMNPANRFQPFLECVENHVQGAMQLL